MAQKVPRLHRKIKDALAVVSAPIASVEETADHPADPPEVPIHPLEPKIQVLEMTCEALHHPAAVVFPHLPEEGVVPQAADHHHGAAANTSKLRGCEKTAALFAIS